MPVKKPSIEDLRKAAIAFHLTLTPEDLTSFWGLTDGVIASYRRLDELAEPRPAVKYPRTTGHRPGADENTFNAWYWKCSIKGAPSGKLAGKTFAIKDNVCVAGIPMMNGTAVLEGYIPDIDATVVTRILDAGGEIAGKAVCESLCFSGGSHTSDPMPVHNPHQRDVRTDTYSEAIKGSVSGLRLAIVKEGFGWEGASEKDVDQMVQDAAHTLERGGAKVTTISLPMHRDGIHIWNAIAVEGATMLMVRGNSMGTNWKGHYTTSLLDVYARGWQSRANDLSETTKLVVMLGQYMQDNYHGRYYAKAQNLARSIRAAYDAALQQADLLVMPTLPMKATPIPPQTASREEYVARALEMIPNTCPFDVTGHPALTVPCGTSSGLPVGMMLIGRHWEDGTILRAGHAFEQMA